MPEGFTISGDAKASPLAASSVPAAKENVGADAHANTGSVGECLLFGLAPGAGAGAHAVERCTCCARLKTHLILVPFFVYPRAKVIAHGGTVFICRLQS